eukprot:1032733_1
MDHSAFDNALIGDFRTSLLISGYIRAISPLHVDIIPKQIIEGIIAQNSTRWRLPRTFMIAFIDDRNNIPPVPSAKFIPYSVPGHLSVKKAIQHVLRLNDQSASSDYKLWKWQYVLYSNIENRIQKKTYNRHSTGWRGWAFIAPRRLVRNKMKFSEYYWLSIRAPQARRQGRIPARHQGRIPNHALNLKMEKRRIITFYQNYYFWFKRSLELPNTSNADNQQSQLMPEQTAMLVSGYLREKSVNQCMFGLVLGWYQMKHDYWDEDLIDLKSCKIESNCFFHRDDIYMGDVDFHVCQAFGIMNMSKAIAKYVWQLKLERYPGSSHAFVGISSDTNAILDCRNNDNCYTICVQQEYDKYHSDGNMISTMLMRVIYKTVGNYGELSIGFNNDHPITFFDEIPIESNQMYKLVVQHKCPTLKFKFV